LTTVSDFVLCRHFMYTCSLPVSHSCAYYRPA